MSASTPDPRSATADHLPLVSPDVGEFEAGELIDNIVPSYGYEKSPVVGIGGSAGAIRALESFFTAAPSSSGLTFVVVMHLAPEFTSMLPQMIQKWTKMRVSQAGDGDKTEPNCVYVIPPGKQLTSTDGHLRLGDLEREPGVRTAVDLFFRSLADTHGPHAVGVVLSGADGDGTIGIKRLKERGGLTIAQDPSEAEHPSMPRSAIESGMVDWVLRTGEMAERIVDYVAREGKLELPSEEGPQPAQSPHAEKAEPEAALREVLVFLRMRTGRDFTYYKRATILRRIGRRMQVNGVEDVPSYLAFLRTHPGEAGALFKDLLISVTNFFRDREAFAAIEAMIPKLFAGKTQSDVVRVWTPACATGEEAYSFAMLLLEHARTLDAPPAVQVFGCDLDEDAVHTARAGLFPETIGSDVSEDRLRRFFVKEHNGYRIRREIREVVLFVAHDLLKDAPFSRLDLVSCRNLLIYLNREAQARAIEIFHFALKPDGLLFLGASEVVEGGNELFRVLDKRHRIYVRKGAHRMGLPVPTGTSLAGRAVERHPRGDSTGATHPGVVPPSAFSQTASLAFTTRGNVGRDPERASWSDVHLKLVDRIAPPSVLVNQDYDILHATQSASRFLHFVGGQPTANLLRLVDPAVRVELRTTLFHAAQSGEATLATAIPAVIGDHTVQIDLRVTPAKDIGPDLYLVVFEEHAAAPHPEETPPTAHAQAEPIVQHLEREIEQVKTHLRDTVEQYEASTEELKASNEELQAMNEELRSATEELETSREELQSINEELTTVNQELKNKVEELAHANSDVHNLMSATNIATLFLDRDMRIMRYTSSAVPIFNLIPGDIGRPLAHLQHGIDYPGMAVDAARVIEHLVPIERQVTGSGGLHFMARMLPYRTVDDRIAGVVLTFVDITERCLAQQVVAQHVDELTRFNEAAVGRESRMIELKQEVNDLRARLGEKPRYDSDRMQD